MPIRFLSDPLGVAILCGDDGPGLIVLATPCHFRPRPPVLGPSMILQLEDMERGPVRCAGQPTIAARLDYLKARQLVARLRTGDWELTLAGRAWLDEHRRRDLGREHHQRRHEAAVFEAVGAGLHRLRLIAARLQLTKPEVSVALKHLRKQGRLENSVADGWRVCGAPARRRRRAA